jgi:hypothetical protein
MMADELASMVRLTGSVQQAATTFEAAKGKLFTADGHPIFQAEQQAKRLQEALAPLQASTETAVSIAKNNTQWAVGRKEALLSADPTTTLTTDELAAAALRAMFVREDLQSMIFPELAARIRAAVTSGDRAGAWLLERYGWQKVRALEEEQRTNSHFDLAAARGLTEATDELGKLADFLQPKRKADLEGLDQIIAKGIELQDFARRTIQVADGSDQQRRAEYAARMRSW